MEIGINGFKGELVLPWDPDYNEARQEWNRRIQKFPRIIAYCTDSEDVSLCIKWANRRGINLRIRAGGHNYEGYSIGNGSLVIDLSRMNRVKIAKGLVNAEGGVNNAGIYGALKQSGNAFPGGTCPTVCASGYSFGGGWGLSCRSLGLGCDSLEAVELVDASGRILTASSHCNQDLFWALRGAGGGNFGVATGLKFRLPDLKPVVVTYIELYYADTGEQQQTNFWETWQEWLAEADERVTLQASIYYAPNEGYAVFSRGLFYGEPDEARRAVEALQALPGCEASYRAMSFYEATQVIGESYPPYEEFKSTGRFVTKDFTREHIGHLVKTLRNHPKGSVFTAYSLYALGGATMHPRKNDTAFFYRDAKYITVLQSVWKDNRFEDINIAWVNRNFPYLAYLTAGSYVNFPYSGLLDYMRAYYGGNAPRLRRVKQLYDPYNVFRFQQSIR